MSDRSFSRRQECLHFYFIPPFLMKSVNTVTLLGNVTRDPEVKSTPTGQVVCRFGLATNRVWKDAKGDKQEVAEFHNVVAWSKLAELEDTAEEDADEVVAGIEEGAEVEASGKGAKQEVAEAALEATGEAEGEAA